MRRFIITTAATLIAGAGASMSHAGDIGFGVTITGEIVPGVYGHVVLGNRAPPPVVYARPMVIEPPPPGVVVAPIYLNVPPDHARHWRLHCHEYHACNRPVYFVRSMEYDPGFNMERWRREHPHHGYGHRDYDHRDYDHRDYDHRDHDRRDYDHRDHDRRYDHDRGHHYGQERGRDHDHDRGHDHRDDRDPHDH